MKIGRTGLELLKFFINKDIKKRRKNYPPHSFREWLNVYYTDKKDVHLAYDVYLANEENRKHRCVIDVHGGSYIFGEHKDNYPFGYEMLLEGYDVILLDYIVNDGKRDLLDIVKDLVNSLNHIRNHLNDYDLASDDFVIVGDSAGGHLALFLGELFSNRDTATKLGLNLPELNIVGVVVSSPVYRYDLVGEGTMSKSGLKRMKGPKYNDCEHLKKVSPHTYINELKYPLFLNTCKNDFIRDESMLLKEDVKDKKDFVFLDINSDDKNVDHVHNVTKPQLKESKEVNSAIAEFIKNL